MLSVCCPKRSQVGGTKGLCLPSLCEYKIYVRTYDRHKQNLTKNSQLHITTYYVSGIKRPYVPVLHITTYFIELRHFLNVKT
jgi:hypothetical protein